MARPYDDSAWFRKKSQILDEFVVSTRGLLDQVATQSHEHPPDTSSDSFPISSGG
jgi:hypothetical protein